MKKIEAFIKKAIEAGASDIHLVVGDLPMMRVNGVLENMIETPLKKTEIETELMGLMTPIKKEQYKETKDVDIAYQYGDQRLRMNIHQQRGSIAMAARLIPQTVPTIEELRFEPALSELAQMRDGLVLIVGPTGHGKSTTIAAMIEHINQTRKSHIITIEDPIEFVFEDKESLIQQREVGEDTSSFASALKHVLRQDPDVILLGEMRDPETIATALTAAETGHLVFSTLHTSSAAEAVERIVDVFDGPKQKQVLIQLASVMRGVVAQQLIPTEAGGRVAAREILLNTTAVSNLIRQNNISQIESVIQTSGKAGMITMEQSLKGLRKEKIISSDIEERVLANLQV
ncbi:MAG: PilT/PilU family type 4a pilus ATPase [Candidatus Magasanikbacteria bacterium]|jgi:twitching motility protein PilT|nr:PilT/PilU family type 4a pilus ATPase [Candidatus Magasanikbacteria bacterium]